MRFSLHSVHGGVKHLDEIRQHAQRAEELAYNQIFIGESHLSSIDSFQTLATCAMLTQRMLLGIAVTNMVFRHPTVLAGAAASLNEISKGRAPVSNLMLTPARKVYHESVETFAAKVIPHFRN
ncbi:MAG TPA: LLM class flavin-dependent oxidoreductase [Candidatus Binatia bacterium]|nr:LLM class flavin-dependent oxidoreductase [Candidatus Binatia bacterium]